MYKLKYKFSSYGTWNNERNFFTFSEMLRWIEMMEKQYSQFQWEWESL